MGLFPAVANFRYGENVLALHLTRQANCSRHFLHIILGRIGIRKPAGKLRPAFLCGPRPDAPYVHIVQRHVVVNGDDVVRH